MHSRIYQSGPLICPSAMLIPRKEALCHGDVRNHVNQIRPNASSLAITRTKL